MTRFASRHADENRSSRHRRGPIRGRLTPGLLLLLASSSLALGAIACSGSNDSIVFSFRDRDCDGVEDESDPHVDFSDTDTDGITNGCDNCVDVPNSTQTDTNGDGEGDACDDDDDGDGVLDVDDNCPLDVNANQADEDSDGLGDVCDDVQG